MSARRLRVVLAAEARTDLRAVLLYSRQQWGAPQRDAYQAALNDAFATLGANPSIGRARDDLAPDVRSLLVRQHNILYRVEADAIRVLRIVHTRRDASEQLGR